MKIELPSAGTGLQPAKGHNHDRQVQGVFSKILEAAGRKGYDSAEKIEGDQLTVEAAQTAFDRWFNIERVGGRYASANRPEELREGYGQVLARAMNEGGYVQPKEFLSRLSSEELELVQNVNWLADPIDVDSLTEEGSLNLLLPGAAQVDLNRDGLTQTGLAYGIRFPNSNTPRDVADAWDEATAGMDFGERAIYELQMMLPLLTANFYTDENGAYSHHFEPGDAEFRNPMAKADYSYRQATQDMLDHLEFSKRWMTEEQYDRQTEFWSRLQGLLEERGAE